MDTFQEYLATEVALDHVGGQITRREALRQLAKLGLSLTAASALIAACGKDNDEEASAPAAQAATTAAPAATTPTTSRV
jgi:carboxymethylenebutenolidase